MCWGRWVQEVVVVEEEAGCVDVGWVGDDATEGEVGVKRGVW